MDNKFGKRPIPGTNGLETRVIVGGMVAGTCRALVETPLEYAKVYFLFLNNYSTLLN